MKPGTTKLAAEVDRLRRAGARANIGRRADGDDAIAGDRDRFGFGLRGVAGPDAAVDERERDHGTSRV